MSDTENQVLNHVACEACRLKKCKASDSLSLYHQLLGAFLNHQQLLCRMLMMSMRLLRRFDVVLLSIADC